MIDPGTGSTSDALADSEVDRYWIRRALTEAARGIGRVEPNPMVGAAVVCEGSLVGLGYHEAFGGPHAEVHALRNAGTDSEGATLYVTLEPCCHQGKTPPCTEAIIESGISKVVASMRDPFPEVSGKGFHRLRSAGIDVQVGVLEADARRLNGPFLKRVTTGRPFVTAKWAMTLDGKTACESGESKWISSPRSRSLVHELRGRMDGILVGMGTVRADDPALTARPPGPRAPVRVVLDPSASLPPESQLAQTVTTIPVWLAVNERAPDDRIERLQGLGLEIIRFGGEDLIPIGPLLDELGARGLTNLLVEGGGNVLGAFFDADEIDAVSTFIAPLIQGGAHGFQPCRGLGVDRMADALRLHHPQIQLIEGDLHFSGLARRPWLEPES